MDIVVDASVIIAVITNEPTKPQLIQMTTGANLLAPPSIHWEIGNAFSAMFKRGRITVVQAMQSLNIYQQITIRFVDVELDKCLRLAADLNIYAYDAYLIRCAIKYRSPLITFDSGLIQAAKQKQVTVMEVI